MLLIGLQVYVRAILFQVEPRAWRTIACARFRSAGLVFAVVYAMIKFDVV